MLERLAKERRARLAAERLLEQKKRELQAANQQLALHARALSEQIVEQRQGLARALSEAASLKGQNSQVLSDLEHATSLARIAQTRLWDALETVRDGFAVFDGDLRLVAANRAWLTFFEGEIALSQGVTYDAVLRIAAQHGLIDLDGRDPLDWHHEMTARIRRAQIEPCVVRLPSGRHLNLIDRWGSEGDLVCLTQDITASIRREAELQEARDRAEAANRAKSAFLANMSHEIRTPMNGVVGMADLLCETEMTEDQRLFAETIRSSGEALLTIINDVLDYSRIEAERMQLYPEPFDLERCLHEVMLLLQPAAREKGLKLLVDFDLFLPTRFIADPGRMRQVLTNLIGNAVKFTASGHVLARVVGIELADGTYELHVTVEDTGIGIAPEHVEHIFGQFNQVDSASNRKFEGTGLGLAITRQLIGMMGGSLWVDSVPGEGSCFGFRVPLTPAEPRDEIDRPSTPIRLKCAMVVDDLLINRVILERQLETYGLEVTLCRSAAEALDVIEGGATFDLVLTDHEMPGMTGLDLAQQLREGGIGVPILLLTSDPEAAQGAAGAAQGGGDLSGIMQKPILRSDLFRTLQALSCLPSEPGPEALPPDRTPEQRRQMRVLAAEDNRTNQLVFRKMVKDFDIALEFAWNGREAVEMWRSWCPDLIFMDISMPEMDGREAARAIRGAEAGSKLHVPIVALTAHAMTGDAESILAAGMDHYLTKPLKKSAIAEYIAEHCPPEARPPLPDERDD
ncbi:response regulator [Frigidibacter mobilis]|uniref:histidine kinase n=1 Tax=Frigidibacter mobilis TaxID=1335048 RepID=A0A159Z719_9RHOB|nr:sensor histidine kinase/response regulator receiver protein [Frigidibacter mobilis]